MKNKWERAKNSWSMKRSVFYAWWMHRKVCSHVLPLNEYECSLIVYFITKEYVQWKPNSSLPKKTSKFQTTTITPNLSIYN